MSDSKDSSNLVNGPSFFQHVFNFSEEGKGELINIMQYSLLSILPIVVLNKCIQKFIPEIDDTKGSAEVLAEIIFQLLAMFVGIVLINRMITFVPTYSGIKYSEINLITIVLAFMMIVLSLQTKLGEKANLLVSRVIDLWDGTGTQTKKPKSNTQGAVNVPVHQPSQADNLSASAIGILPQGPPGLPNTLATQPTAPVQQQPQQSFQGFYEGPNTPLVDATEPMAANAMPTDAFSNLF